MILKSKGSSWQLHLAARNVTMKCGVLQTGSTLITAAQDFAIFSSQFPTWLCQVLLKYFGGHPRLGSYIVGSLLTFFKQYVLILSHVRVTLNGILDWRLDLLTTYRL
jgi:hypothetical protein